MFRRPCSHIDDPPHSLHRLRWRPCSHFFGTDPHSVHVQRWSEVPGHGKWSRVVLLEFPSLGAASAWADPDGGVAKWHAMRHAHATSRMVRLEDARPRDVAVLDHAGQGDTRGCLPGGVAALRCSGEGRPWQVLHGRGLYCTA